MHEPIAELEARIDSYDPEIATREQWEEHVRLVRELFRRRVQLLRVIQEATEN